jgi:sialidase-1
MNPTQIDSLKQRIFTHLLFKIKYQTGNAVKYWHGYHQQFYLIGDRLAYVVSPLTPLERNPWVWRTRFPDFHIQMDLVLLKLGFHIVYVYTDRMHGGPANLRLYDQWYDFAIKNLKLAEKMTLEAVSRGGLIAYAWAKRNPEKINSIYADTPVCDIKSWPFGQGQGKRSLSDWQLILKEYNLTEAQALEYQDNPIDNLEPLVKLQVPILHLIGLNDRVVVPEENTYILQKRYLALGGSITVLKNQYGKEEAEGHHFEIDEPWRIVEFILENTPEYHNHFNPEAYFPNYKIEKKI